MTAKSQILLLHAQGKSTREIATEVYALPPDVDPAEADRKMAYVRVVLRQRHGGRRGLSRADEAYLLRKYGGGSVREALRRRSAEYYADADHRERHNRNERARYHRNKAASAARKEAA